MIIYLVLFIISLIVISILSVLLINKKSEPCKIYYIKFTKDNTSQLNEFLKGNIKLYSTNQQYYCYYKNKTLTIYDLKSNKQKDYSNNITGPDNESYSLEQILTKSIESIPVEDDKFSDFHMILEVSNYGLFKIQSSMFSKESNKYMYTTFFVTCPTNNNFTITGDKNNSCNFTYSPFINNNALCALMYGHEFEYNDSLQRCALLSNPEPSPPQPK